jgi:hypothetical protein
MVPKSSHHGIPLMELNDIASFFFPFIIWWPTKRTIYYKNIKQLDGLHTSARIRKAEIHGQYIKSLGWDHFLMRWVFSRSFRRYIMGKIQSDELEYTHPIIIFELQKNYRKEQCRISDLYK